MRAAEEWTPEQLHAIENRTGDLFLDAAAGSGKTSVLVERFVRDVLEDGIEVPSILAITFTEKAAAEMRERIRTALRQLGAVQAARAAEGALISTIHGFCARVLRAHALEAGIDPGFAVLDEADASSLSGQAFDAAIEELAESADGAELIAAYGIWDLRGAVLSAYAQLRSRGQLRPRLPEVGAAPDLAVARERVVRSAARALAELAAVAEPAARVLTAIDRLERAAALGTAPPPWPGALDELCLPGGNGAALRTDACVAYADALAELREGVAHHFAVRVRDQLDALLTSFAVRYEQQKRERSALDFEDLELLCLELLRAHPALAERYRERYERVMVDELQDTNGVQLALVKLISDGNLFTVGDAQQSIYGFRHADVSLFEGLGDELAGHGARSTLSTNFRSRREILEVINRVFSDALGEGYVRLVPGVEAADQREDRVELLIVDRGSDEIAEDQTISWRVAEARMLADRVAELLASGAAARDVVVLTRASTDMRVYERALEERGLPTYVIGGRGYWSHPQVLDVAAYLRLLANPRDEEALYTVLVSPIVGVSYDTLVLIASAARAASRDPWWLLREPPEAGLDELNESDRGRLAAFVPWADGERRVAARASVQELIDRMLERTGYDLAVLAMAGGQRRLANVRKLMRLGREHHAAHGVDLRGFLDLVAERSGPGRRSEEDSEAPVEGEALDAVRLMTIHRAKGLEFPIVCVADLGRLPRWGGEVLRIGADGTLGLRLARPGTGRREAALAYESLGKAQREAEAREERRLFYVAATRAKERLIFSAAANVEAIWGGTPGSAPIGWLGPALVPELPALIEQGLEVGDGVRFAVAPPGPEPTSAIEVTARPSPAAAQAQLSSLAALAPAPTSLSYTSLAGYGRCGYRFYVERVLGLPAVDAAPAGGGGARERSGLERGTLVHSLLERLDFRRPVPPSAEADPEIAQLIERFVASELAARLGRASAVRREQPFAFLLDDTLITGAVDVIADENRGTALVVDYKTDRLEGRSPEGIVAQAYLVQRFVYALAALRAGYERVEVVHVFLEAPQDPVVANFTLGDVRVLEEQLEPLVSRVRAGEYRVTESPHRAVCGGCPAEGGLCSWSLEMTRRDSPDSLF
jgi:ATP-dependent exoDNAse (exonuclease V) beta subunit